jgi:hypothetical protein
MGAWGRRHLPVTRELSVRAELLEEGGPDLWNDFMAELRTHHLGAPPPPGEPVSARLRAAYEAAVAGSEEPLKNLHRKNPGNPPLPANRDG